MFDPKRNRFLQSLSSDSLEAVASLLEGVSLPRGTVLHDAHERSRFAYFLTAGLLSSVIVTEAGKSAEVGLLGCEGVVNSLQILGPEQPPTRAMIQIEATALRIRLSDLKRLFQSSEDVRGRLLQFVQNEAFSSLQVAGCHRLHSTEQRMARWLLMVMDRIESADLLLTHSFLGIMLGTGRPTVTLVLHGLVRRGLIQLHRGGVSILDRPGLEQSACECYAVIRQYEQALYNTADPRL